MTNGQPSPPYRLGLDVGANSIGWCLVEIGGETETSGLLALGTRLLTASDEAGRDPQTGASLAVDRRVARGMRRRRDRHLLRKDDLMRALVAHGLMPAEESARKALEQLDPYEVRVQALDGPVPLHHLGRALFHLHQRRGFKSNRRSDRANTEAGLIAKGIESLREKMAAECARTIGEFLARRHAVRETVRARMRGAGKDAHYPFYLERALLEEEFDGLWVRQAAHHPELTDAARDVIRGIMFRQRELREVRPGKCALHPETDDRAPRALPDAQRFRILKELADLRLREPTGAARPLTVAERDALLHRLSTSAKLSFDQTRRLLKLGGAVSFNLESERRKDLKGDETAARLGAKKLLGKAWHALDRATRAAVVERLLTEQDPSVLVAELARLLPGHDPDVLRQVAACPMPEGHSHYGRRALGDLVRQMEVADFTDPETGEVIDTRPMTEVEAVARLGFHHSDRRPTETLPRLPYYGEVLTDAVIGTGDPKDPLETRVGRIPNPTVHIALNQLRRVVNAIVARHGPPAEIAIELARELKLSREQKREIEREQTENQKANEERRKRLLELGQRDTGTNRLKLRLHDELPAEEKVSVYSGRKIRDERQLLSAEIEVDHILPFSRTLDDGIGNKVLCFREENRGKRNRTPAEFFTDPDQYAAVLERAMRLLPASKSWRFAPDAMERFDDGGFGLPRRLTDTQYMARLALRYLQHVCPSNKVWATNGRMTAMLRGKWGLNPLLPDHNVTGLGQPKNRRDHRHHAIDAFVTAVTTRSLVQRIAKQAGRAEDQELERILEDMPDPWPGFREALDEAVNRTVVSHRPDHGIQGKLHEETAYGPVTEAERAEGWTVSHHKPVDGLSANEMRRIRDRDLRARVETVLAAEGEDAARALVADDGRVKRRRVKLLKRENPEGLIEIRHGPGGRFSKFYTKGAQHHIDIVELPDGSWTGEAVSVFDANQPGFTPRWTADGGIGRLVMRLHKGDLVEVEHKGARRVMRVYQLEPSANRIRLAGHNEAGALQNRHADADDPFRWFIASYSRLKSGGARPVRTDLLGRVFYLDASTDDSGSPPS